MIQAFAGVGVDAGFDESTPDREFDAKMREWDSVPTEKRTEVWKKLLELNQKSLDDFMLQLERAVVRNINSVRIIPLHGSTQDCVTVMEALAFVEHYNESAPTGPLVKYEVFIKYDNGDKVEGQFQNRASTIDFLTAYLSGNWTASIDALADDEE